MGVEVETVTVRCNTKQGGKHEQEIAAWGRGQPKKEKKNSRNAETSGPIVFMCVCGEMDHNMGHRRTRILLQTAFNSIHVRQTYK